jgi:hypothetical protein
MLHFDSPEAAEQRIQDLDRFVMTCEKAFPQLEWELYGDSNPTITVNALAIALIPELQAAINVVFWFATADDSEHASASFLVGEFHKLVFFRSAKERSQSLDEALKLLREYLNQFRDNVNKILEQPENHTLKVETISLPAWEPFVSIDSDRLEFGDDDY